MLPALSATRPCGPDWGVLSGYSFIAPVLGSSRPSTLDHCPVHQMEPSAAARGSCGREPSEGTTHSLIATVAVPGTSTAAGGGRSGELLDKYSANTAVCSGGSPTIDVRTSSHPSRVYPPELAIRLSWWHAVQVAWTRALPGRSGRWTGSRRGP